MSDSDGVPISSIATRLGLGLAAIGRPAYITVGRTDDLGEGADRSIDAMQSRAHALLEAAFSSGIRYFDAARSYGSAERFLGSWLAEHPGRRDEVSIGSKWGYEYVGGWNMQAETQERKEHSLGMLTRQWPETLEALGGEPDVYLIHSLTPDSPALGDEALLDRLREIAVGGVRVGFSTSGPSQGAMIERVLAMRDSPFSAVQTTWNLLEQSAETALAAANDAGWLVVVKEVLANGRLTPRGSEAAAAALASRDEQSLDALAIGAALAHPWADIVLTGAVTGRQLAENVAARQPRVSEDELAKLTEAPDVYWAERSARAWT